MNRFYRFTARVVLCSFLFQTIWPSLVLAELDIALGSAWRDEVSGLTLKVEYFKDIGTSRDLVRIQASCDPEEKQADVNAKAGQKPKTKDPSLPLTFSLLPTPSPIPSTTTLTHPRSLSPTIQAPLESEGPVKPPLEDRVKRLLDRTVDLQSLTALETGYSLYNDLVIKDNGISWGFAGLVFVLDSKKNLLTTGAANFDMPLKIGTNETVFLDNLHVKQVIARGKDVFLRGTGKIDRLDTWAFGEGKGGSQKQGSFQVTQGSTEEVGTLFIHEGVGENHGNLTINEAISGKSVFTNDGDVNGDTYKVQNPIVRNLSHATMSATRKLTLDTPKLEQKGTLKAPELDLSAVAEIEDSTGSSFIKANQFKTALKKSWTLQGNLEAETWSDTSTPGVTIHNQGTITTTNTTSLLASLHNLKEGKMDLTGLDLKTPNDTKAPLINEGGMVLRRIVSLGRDLNTGSYRNVENKQGAELNFDECGALPMSPFSKDTSGIPSSFLSSGALHLGSVTNAGIIGFRKGTYAIHGTFGNTKTGVRDVLEGQELWVQDLINEGVTNATGTYTIDQRLGVFTKLGKVLMKGKLITQMSEKALRSKTGGTTWQHKGHIEADEWVDQSDSNITIENTGKIIVRKSANLSAQYQTGRLGVSDLTGVRFAKPLDSSKPLTNQGTMILRKVGSLGDKKRSILNEKGAQLLFLDGEYSYKEGDSTTGGLIMGAVTNHGEISFGGGNYYTDLFTNHNIHNALLGMRLRVADLLNYGVSRSDAANYIIDMRNGVFTKLGKVQTIHDLTLRGGPNVDMSQILTGNQFEVRGKLILEGHHWTISFGKKEQYLCPLYLTLSGLLTVDGLLSTNDLKGTLGGIKLGRSELQKGTLLSKRDVDLVLEDQLDNRFGKFEINGTGKIILKKGKILVGNSVSGYQKSNGSYILGHGGLELETPYEILNQCGEISSEGPMTLRAGVKILNQTGRIRSFGSLTLSTPLLQNHTVVPVASGSCQARDGNGYGVFYTEGGDQSEIYSSEDLYLDIAEVENHASLISAFGDIYNKNYRKVDPKKPWAFFKRFETSDYYCRNSYHWQGKTNGEIWNAGGDRAPVSQVSLISGSKTVSLSFTKTQLEGLIMTAASILMNGDVFTLGSTSSSSSITGTPSYGYLSLLPAIQGLSGGMMQHRSVTENPYTVYSPNSFKINIIDPLLLILVGDAMSKSTWLSSPTEDSRYLRQLCDINYIAWALQKTLMKSTRKGYLFPKKGAMEHIKLLLENARQFAKGGSTLSRTQIETSKEPLLTFEEEIVEGEKALVPYSFIPKDYINNHLFESTQGTLVSDEGVKINMQKYLGVFGGVMDAEGEDIGLNSQGKMDLEATASREYTDGGYKDSKTGGAFYAPNGKLTGTSTDDLNRKAITVETQKGAFFNSDGKGVDASLPLHSHESHTSGKTTTETHRIHHETSKYHHPKGPLKEGFQGPFDTYAQKIEAVSAHAIASKVTEHDVQDTVQQTTTTKGEKGFLGMGGSSSSQSQTVTSSSRGSTVKLKTERTVTATLGDIILTGVNYQVPKTILFAPNGAIQLLASQNTSKSMKTEQKSQGFWQTVSQDSSVDVTHTPCQFSGEVDTQAKAVLVEKTKGQTLEWLERLKTPDDVEVMIKELQEIHQSHHEETSGPTAALSAVVALAVTLATYGTGAASFMGSGAVSLTGTTVGTPMAAIVADMGAAGFSALCSSSAVSLLQNKGDIGKTLQSLSTSSTLTNIGISMASAGLVRGIGAKMGIITDPKALSLATKTGVIEGIQAHLKSQLLRQGVGLGLRLTLTQDKERDALTSAIRGVVSGTLGGVGANVIGQAYGSQEIDVLTHKILHGLVGGTSGFILEGEKGIIPGAMGAMVAESVMEFSKSKLEGMAIDAAQETMEEEETSSSSQMPSKHQLFEDSLRQTQDIAKLITASTLMMLGVDGVNVGIETATTAVENNFVPAVILVYYTATTLWSLYDAYQIYEEEGGVVAAESLIEDAALFYVGGKGLSVALKTAGKLATSAKVGTKAKAFFQKFVTKGEKVAEEAEKTGVKLELKFKEGMDPRDFDRKITSLQRVARDGRLESGTLGKVSDSERQSLTREYRKKVVARINDLYKDNPEAKKNALERLRKSDIDHTIDLQLGGENRVGNLRALEKTVNRSTGPQIQKQLPKEQSVTIIDVIIKK